MPGAGGRRKSGGGQEARDDKESLTNGTRNGSQKDDLDTPSKKDGKNKLTGRRSSEADANGAIDGKADASCETSRTPKKARKEESIEEDDRPKEDSAVFVAPVDEAGDALASAQPRRKRGISDSDPEDGLVEVASLAAWRRIEDDGADHDFDAWRRAVEDLRRKRPPELARGGGDKPSIEELLRQLRSALQGGDWGILTAAPVVARPTDMAAAARQLSRSEALETLTVLAARHESHPRERLLCGAWIQQVLDQQSQSLVGTRELRTALRPLLVALATRLGPASRSGEALRCLGKWRMASGLARVRRQALQASEVADSAVRVAEGDGFAEDDDDEEDLDDEEEEDEDQAPPAASRKKATADSDSDD